VNGAYTFCISNLSICRHLSDTALGTYNVIIFDINYVCF